MLKSKRDGFSLIEVMVALVILVIGLIGIFNLHIVAKRSSFESFQQTQAAYLANDMLNRMKLNSSQLGQYSNQSPYEVLPSLTGMKVCEGASVNCSPSELAVWDAYQWTWLLSGAAEKSESDSNIGGLDNAVGCVSVVNKDVTIAIAWKGIRATKNSSSASDCDTAGGLDDRRRLFVLKSVIDAK